MTHIKVTEEKNQPPKSDSTAEPKEPVKKETKTDCESKLQEKEKEAKDLYDRYLRLSAEMENFKKRAEKEKGETYKFANETLLKELIPVLDNLERALDQGQETKNAQALLLGVEMIHKSLWAVLEKYGVTRVEALGEKFDPNFHEAVMVQEVMDQDPGVVITQMQKGYLLHNRLIRPAMVVVSKKPELNPDEEPEAQS